MANMNDYLLWRGKNSISDDSKFNEVDSLILARFSYLPFNKIQLNEEETIESICQKISSINERRLNNKFDENFINFLGKSSRFKNLLVTDYINNDDKKLEKQFTAITIHISDSEMYISFMGTNNTIYGWKEDFNMSFMENVPCQVSGMMYVKTISKKYPQKLIRIGGHSKGGNVAIYSAITSPIKIQDRIIKVYNYDGPGFNKKIIDKYENASIINKIETYIPQDSIIGRVLDHKEKTTITFSEEKGIFQHDIFSWQVSDDELILSKENTKISEDIDDTLTEWLENTTVKQRKVFFDTVFDLLYATDAATFKEISNNLSQSIPKILIKYNEISNEDKKTIIVMIKKMFNAYINIISKRQKEKLNNFKKNIFKINKE